MSYISQVIPSMMFARREAHSQPSLLVAVATSVHSPTSLIGLA